MKSNRAPGSLSHGTLMTAAIVVALVISAVQPSLAQKRYRAPSGNLPATRHVKLGFYDAAVLPNGRFVTPVGVEASVGAPKPFGMSLSPDGNTLATVNSGVRPFSVSLISGLKGSSPMVNVIQVNASELYSL